MKRQKSGRDKREKTSDMELETNRVAFLSFSPLILSTHTFTMKKLTHTPLKNVMKAVYSINMLLVTRHPQPDSSQTGKTYQAGSEVTQGENPFRCSAVPLTFSF